jgi:ABC-type nickel/cobalt efflux system permease component RcnA
VNDGSNDDQPRARAAGSAPTRETVVLDAAHLYLEGTAAAVIMAVLGAISGLATLALADDQRLALLVAAVAFTLTGIILTVRLWRMTRAAATPTEPPA